MIHNIDEVRERERERERAMMNIYIYNINNIGLVIEFYQSIAEISPALLEGKPQSH